MPRKKFENPEEKKRLQVICTPKQEQIITDGARRAGMENDRSAWILAHAIRAAGGKDDGAPLIISGELADRIRAAADAQGTTPEEIVKQWSITAA